jgi:1D-myo-inositol 3-kinase
LRYDYATVGHVCVDVMPDGSRRPGGAAFYSALQAARLGRATLIVTKGHPAEIEELLEPYRDELDLQISPAATTTKLQSSGFGPERFQRVLSWAGQLEQDLALQSSIVHLAPIARELPSRWDAGATRANLVGLTPQGLVREWDAEDGQISLTPAPVALERLARSCQAIVLSVHERESCEGLIAAARSAGAIVAVTAGAEPITLLDGGRGGAEGGHGALELAVPALAHAEAFEDLGAGDVFAAAFFIALSEGEPPERAAGFASAAAAVRMLGEGAAAIGDRTAIEARLAAHGVLDQP